MEWVAEIETRQKAVSYGYGWMEYEGITEHSPAADIAKLITALKVAEKALVNVKEHAEREGERNIYWAYATGALAQLQSGEFGKRG
ncbi:hypothetical protein AAC03nite_20370 [Alicyclobacillus acidoterrestris]|nr:hypothetical protein AAC03nite_20370 [Alicyclobacillus acidoterrestris]